MTYISNISQIVRISKYFFKQVSKKAENPSSPPQVSSPAFSAAVGPPFLPQHSKTRRGKKPFPRGRSPLRRLRDSAAGPGVSVGVQKRITDKFIFYDSHIIFIQLPFVNKKFVWNAGKMIFYLSEIHIYFDFSWHK
jgi:hypothetical protein